MFYFNITSECFRDLRLSLGHTSRSGGNKIRVKSKSWDLNFKSYSRNVANVFVRLERNWIAFLVKNCIKRISNIVDLHYFITLNLSCNRDIKPLSARPRRRIIDHNRHCLAFDQVICYSGAECLI